jgi:hypothetical protein
MAGHEWELSIRRVDVVKSKMVVVVGVLSLVGVLGCTPPGHGGGGGVVPPGSSDSVDLGGQVVTAEVPEGLTVVLEPEEMGVLPPAPPGFEFPFGAVGVTVGGVAPGSVVRVEVGFSSPVDTVRKLVGGVWERFAHDGLTGALVSADGLSVSLDLQDGGRGDTDGVANGVIVDPLAPTEATSLAITTVDVPTAWLEESYSFQLQAAGATGTVHWSILPGSMLPAGLTVSDSGLISGTPTGGGFFVRVQAADDVATATKLLLFGAFAKSSVASTGVPLPEGSQIAVVGIGGSGCLSSTTCSGSVDLYQADGTLEPIETISVNTYRVVAGPSGFLNPVGSQAVMPSTSSGPATVVDADSGVELASLEPEPGFAFAYASFSPDGAYLALIGGPGGAAWIYDTSDWHVTRSVVPPFGPSMLTWAPDSTEFAFGGDLTEGAINAYSSTDPSGVSDRTFLLPTPSCSMGRPVDWSVTDRLAVVCPGDGGVTPSSVLTLSAADGSDVRVVATGGCSASLCIQYAGPASFPLRFSPSGEYLVVSELLSDPTFSGLPSSRIGFTSDVAPGPLTYLTSPLESAGPYAMTMGNAWR